MADTGVIAELLADFTSYLQQQNYAAKGGQIIDASIVAVPQQRNNRDEKATSKAGKQPDTSSQPANSRQKNTAARWVKQQGMRQYGYKSHLKVDRRHKLLRRFHVTAAAVHDNQVVATILAENNTTAGLGL